MFNNLSFRPKSQPPVASDAELGAAAKNHIADQTPQPATTPTNTASANSRRTRNKYIRVDMSDFELFTPGGCAHSEPSVRHFHFQSGGNNIGSDSDIADERAHEMAYDEDSSWYSSASQKAKSAAKRNPKSGSGIGATLDLNRTNSPERTAKTLNKSGRHERSEKGSLPHSSYSRSGITKGIAKINTDARGRGHTPRHRRKFSSTTGKLDSISISTWEAYASLAKAKDDDESYTTVDTPTLWYALSRIPGFSFPTLYSFLHDSHAWVRLDATVAGYGAGSNCSSTSGTVYSPEDCIDSLNTDMPLGRRAQTLDRLAWVLSSPSIQRVCGSSVVRKRVPNFIRTVMEEPSRIWSAEAAAVSRQLGFMTAALERNDVSFRNRNLSPIPLATTLDRVFARRFNLSVPNAKPSPPVDVNSMGDGDVSTTITTVDGSALALAMQDLMSILASARRLFEKQRALPPLREHTNPAATREQQAVYKVFNAANTIMQKLEDVQRQLRHCEATANGQITVEDDLVDSLNSAFDSI